MLMPWFGECVRIYPINRWQKRLQALESQLNKIDSFGYGEDESDLRRLIYGMAIEIGMDGHGRFVIPQHVREDAGIDREIYWVGLGDFLECWNPERLQDRLSGDNARRLRARLVSLFSRDDAADGRPTDGSLPEVME